MDKLEVARRHLGTALALFLDDLDPVSVHTLARAGCEIVEFLAEQAGSTPFRDHMLASGYTIAEIRSRQHRFANAFKHALHQDRRTPRDDTKALAEFSDERNDSDLLVGWKDYMLASGGTMPVEAQVFEVWYIAKHLDKLHPDTSREPYEKLFPDLNSLPRSHQKLRLRRAIETYRSKVLSDPTTDPRPLVLR